MRVTLLILSFLFGIHFMFAQEETSPFEYGPKFGLSVSELKGTEHIKSLRSSFLAGVMGEYKLTERYSVHAELLYTRQGSSNRGNVEGAFFENRINLNYINVPLLAKYYLKEGLALEAGPQFGYLMNATYDSKQPEASRSFNVDDDFENFDLSLSLGANYKTDWGFLFGLRYTLGLNDINNGLEVESGSLRNAVFQLYFGYLIN